MSVSRRIRSLEARAELRARVAGVCGMCGGKGKYNVRREGPFGRRDERPLEPCPGCGKVDLMTIALDVGPRVTPLLDLSRAVQVS